MKATRTLQPHRLTLPFPLRCVRMILALGILLLAGAARAEEVLVSAASSLTNVMREMATEFTSHTQEVTITLNFGATGQLQQQIEQGAPVHLFAGAAPSNLQALEQAGLLAESGARIMACNVMVLALRPGLELPGATSFSLLLDPAVRRIAIGQPQTVPAGKYAVALLERLGTAAALQPKLVYAENVRQALTWAELGEVDAALIYGTDARQSGKVQVVAQTDPAGPPRIEYAVALTLQGAASPGARAFAEFIAGPAGQAALARHGFLPPQ